MVFKSPANPVIDFLTWEIEANFKARDTRIMPLLNWGRKEEN